MARDLENAKRLKKEWYEQNKELTKERARVWHLANPEKVSQKNIAYKAKNKEKVTEYNKQWWSENKDKRASYQAKRKATILQKTPNWLTESDLRMIEAKYSLAAMLTRETGIIHHVDHIIPLQGRKVSGLHVFSNLRVILGSDNVKKSNKYPI